jgi:hypothetical protein
MPWFVAEKAYDGPGPVEAVSESIPIGPFLLPSSWSKAKTILRASLAPEHRIDGVEVISFFFVYLADVETILGLANLNGSDDDSSILSPVIDDALDFPSQLDRVVRASRPFFQDPITNVFFQSPQEHSVSHQ